MSRASAYLHAVRICASAAGLPEPLPEYEFLKPSRKFAFDFAWPDLHPSPLALEIQGGVFGRGPSCPLCGRRRVGAHSSIKDILRDHERLNAAAILGWRVIFCTPRQVEDGSLLALLQRAAGTSRITETASAQGTES
jgi:hypothetical protein